jgi:hypothetical protein
MERGMTTYRADGFGRNLVIAVVRLRRCFVRFPFEEFALALDEKLVVVKVCFAMSDFAFAVTE